MGGKLIILRRRILENLQQKWTVKQLVDSIGMSESNIQKLFKDEVPLSNDCTQKKVFKTKESRKISNNISTQATRIQLII